MVKLVPNRVLDEKQITEDLRPIGEVATVMKFNGMGAYGSLTKEQQELENELNKPLIEPSEFSIHKKIPTEKLSEEYRDNGYEHYWVKFGMNILVPHGQIKKIRFYLTILGDGELSKGVFAVDGFPNDQIIRKNILKGTIKLNVNSALQLIPDPVAQIAAGITDIDIEPWKFEWGYNKLKVGFSEANTNKPQWYVEDEKLNQAFQCSITLRKRKDIQKVTAKIHAIYAYDSSSGVFGRFKKLTGSTVAVLETKSAEIDIV